MTSLAASAETPGSPAAERPSLAGIVIANAAGRHLQAVPEEGRLAVPIQVVDPQHGLSQHWRWIQPAQRLPLAQFVQALRVPSSAYHQLVEAGRRLQHPDESFLVTQDVQIRGSVPAESHFQHYELRHEGSHAG